MSFAPPPHIAELLEAFGLADPGQIRRAGRSVRRLGRQLPQFDSVWADALAQCGVITRWQAGEICAGRGEQLKLGPYVATEPLSDCLYAQACRARHIDSGQWVRLIIAPRGGRDAREAGARLRDLIEVAGGLETDYCALPIAAGQVEQEPIPSVFPAGRPDTGRLSSVIRLWVAADWTPGRSAADWLIAHGRMPAAAVVEIARAMAAGLAQLESVGLCHGDIAASSLWLAADGRMLLPLPGVRGILRPEEGYSRADLTPEAFDYLAPERVSQGTPPNMAADLYACGCVWWHLLCGRAPLAGGDSLSKLRAAHEARILDPRELAPDTPAAFAEILLACIRPEPERRPRGAAELASLLGPPTPQGYRLFRRALRAAESPSLGWPSMRAPVSERPPRRLLQPAVMGLALAASLLVAAWPIWRAVREKGADAQSGRQIALQAKEPARQTESGASPDAPATVAGGKTTDRDVLPATYLANSEDMADNRRRQDGERLPAKQAEPSGVSSVEDLLLEGNKLASIERLDLRPGQRVLGPNGSRAQLLVPAVGLHVAVDGADAEHPIQFEGIDFVWDHPGSADAAMLVVEARHVQFRDCTFHARASNAVMPAAVRWIHPSALQASAIALPSGSIRFTDCLFHDVAAGLDCRTLGAARIEFVNILHLGPGPLMYSPQGPRAEDSMNLVLEQVTLRGAASLWRCGVDSPVAAEPGRILVRADRSVFVPAEGGSLIRFHGEGDPMPILHNLVWEGEGALVTPGTHIAMQERPGGMPNRLDDTNVPIAGLVLSEVEFAGPADGDVAHSRLLRWNAPLRSPDAPGCNPGRLPGNAPLRPAFGAF